MLKLDNDVRGVSVEVGIRMIEFPILQGRMKTCEGNMHVPIRKDSHTALMCLLLHALQVSLSKCCVIVIGSIIAGLSAEFALV